LRENPDFLKLDIEEEHKEKIRQRVQEDLQRRQEELEEADRRLQDEEKQQQGNKSWKNLFKKKP
jgi:Skp family chaperone for outer membrane proteins